ncbi:MAG: hypothetical protein CVV56_08440 [Tenericutes bacterium HGW-Tenericutes-1]|nr:MAG: hypothetical protein CVV56_08440 [Tenericutes bacterium HGW-Tenericutes-1]
MKNKISTIVLSIITIAFVIICFFLGEKIFFACIGGMLLLSSIKLIVKRIRFHFASKEIVIGEVIKIEKIIGDEGGYSYQPIILYKYCDIEYYYKNQIASFTFKKKYNVGEKIELLVDVNNPKIAKRNQPLYLNLDFYLSIIFLCIGLFVIYMSIK